MPSEDQVIRLEIHVDDETARLLEDGDSDAWARVADFVLLNANADRITIPAIHAVVR
ncbi:hypothetical protein [Streptomyces sp. CNZ748]|uniref:hypothetical protein n=1 Tax=Streptomyces sp. CNZ748 TaxID=2885160 RepID=UPI001E42EE26|nr:hypothetical protein [Streptomyces sp. CNZ748]